MSASLSAAPCRVEQWPIQFQRHGSTMWFWRGAPTAWAGRVMLHFQKVPFDRIVSSQSLRHYDRVEYWANQIRQNRAIPALVVCITEGGFYYLQDGNHRYTAIQSLLGSSYRGEIEVAELVPAPDYEFRRVQLGCASTGWYSTYVLLKRFGSS